MESPTINTDINSPPRPPLDPHGPSLIVNNNHMNMKSKSTKPQTSPTEQVGEQDTSFCDLENDEEKQEFFSLRWNDFFPNLLNTFSDLRDSGELTDVTIAVTSDGQHSFKAHKVILSAISPFFRQILKDNPCQHPIIILKDIGRFEMENLLTFIYQGEVQIANNDLNQFLKTAQSLRVKGLTDCSKLENQENNSSSSSSQNKSSSKQIKIHNIDKTVADDNGGKKHTSSKRLRGKKRRRQQNRLKFMNLNDQDQEVEQDLRINTQNRQHLQENLQENFDPSDPSDLDMELEEQSQSNNNVQFTRSSDASDIDYDDDDDDGQMMQPEIRLLESSPPNSSGDNKSILVQALLQKDKNSVKNYSITDRKDDDSNSLVMDEDFISSIENESNSTKIAAAALLGFHHQAIHQQQQEQQQALPLITTTNPSSLSAIDFQGNKSGRGHQTSDMRQIISSNNSQQLMNERVRATDPRPCPKCSKIYRSAHTLRTHLEDKHTICPGYRCVLCGTVAKSRNSLHSHMSRQHRGISTKDLPVLPMPSAFDPQLAARLLKKAGHKMSHSEGSQDGSGGNSPLSPAGERGKHRSKRMHRSAGSDDEDEQAVNQTTGSVILDTYLQFIAENSQAAVQRLLSSHGQTLEQFQNANNINITNAIANIPQSVSISSVSASNNNPGGRTNIPVSISSSDRGIGDGFGVGGGGKRQKLSNNNKVLKSNNNNSDEIISPNSEDIIGLVGSRIEEIKSQKKNNNKTKSLEELESNNISCSTTNTSTTTTNTNSIEK